MNFKDLPIFIGITFLIVLIVFTYKPAVAKQTPEQTITITMEYSTPTVEETKPEIEPAIKKLNYTSKNYRRDVEILTEALFHEARSDNYEKVFALIFNRIQHDIFPNTVEEVVYQPKQFSYVEELSIKERKKRERKELAKYNEIRKWVNATLASGKYTDYTHGSLYYYAHNRMNKPYWWEDKYHTVSSEKHSFASWHKVKSS